MDQIDRLRQDKVTEGAGLTEARMNTEFIRWLQNWGPYLLMALAALSAAYWGWTWWQNQQEKARQEAYAQLASAMESGSPDNLIRVAKEHGDRGAVAELATLHAADVYLESALRRITPGGKPNVESDKLNDEQRKANLEQARTLYAEVVARAGSNPGRSLQSFNGKFGLASVAATSGDVPGALKILDEIVAGSKASNLPGLAEQAERVKASLARAQALPALYTREQVAVSARPPSKPVDLPPMPAGPMEPTPGATTQDGLQLPPSDLRVDPNAPASTPPPAPAPAPESAAASGDAATPPKP